MSAKPEETACETTTDGVDATMDAGPPPSSALALFGAGLLGSVLALVGGTGLLLPMSATHCGCGAPASRRLERQRCLETGLTPAELAAQDAALAASPGAPTR